MVFALPYKTTTAIDTKKWCKFIKASYGRQAAEDFAPMIAEFSQARINAGAVTDAHHTETVDTYLRSQACVESKFPWSADTLSLCFSWSDAFMPKDKRRSKAPTPELDRVCLLWNRAAALTREASVLPLSDPTRAQQAAELYMQAASFMAAVRAAVDTGRAHFVTLSPDLSVDCIDGCVSALRGAAHSALCPTDMAGADESVGALLTRAKAHAAAGEHLRAAASLLSRGSLGRHMRASKSSPSGNKFLGSVAFQAAIHAAQADLLVARAMASRSAWGQAVARYRRAMSALAIPSQFGYQPNKVGAKDVADAVRSSYERVAALVKAEAAEGERKNERIFLEAVPPPGSVKPVPAPETPVGVLKLTPPCELGLPVCDDLADPWAALVPPVVQSAKNAYAAAVTQRVGEAQKEFESIIAGPLAALAEVGLPGSIMGLLPASRVMTPGLCQATRLVAIAQGEHIGASEAGSPPLPVAPVSQSEAISAALAPIHEIGGVAGLRKIASEVGANIEEIAMACAKSRHIINSVRTRDCELKRMYGTLWNNDVVGNILNGLDSQIEAADNNVQTAKSAHSGMDARVAELEPAVATALESAGTGAGALVAAASPVAVDPAVVAAASTVLDTLEALDAELSAIATAIADTAAAANGVDAAHLDEHLRAGSLEESACQSLVNEAASDLQERLGITIRAARAAHAEGGSVARGTAAVRAAAAALTAARGSKDADAAVIEKAVAQFTALHEELKRGQGYCESMKVTVKNLERRAEGLEETFTRDAQRAETEIRSAGFQPQVTGAAAAVGAMQPQVPQQQQQQMPPPPQVQPQQQQQQQQQQMPPPPQVPQQQQQQMPPPPQVPQQQQQQMPPPPQVPQQQQQQMPQQQQQQQWMAPPGAQPQWPQQQMPQMPQQQQWMAPSGAQPQWPQQQMPPQQWQQMPQQQQQQWPQQPPPPGYYGAPGYK